MKTMFNLGGGTGGTPDSVSQTRGDILADNYWAWVDYVLAKGAYYNDGYLHYKGKLLTKVDTAYITRGSFDDHIATEEELRAAWLALLDIAGVEGE